MQKGFDTAIDTIHANVAFDQTLYLATTIVSFTIMVCL